jgi:outer membrane protein insertion porin family
MTFRLSIVKILLVTALFLSLFLQSSYGEEPVHGEDKDHGADHRVFESPVGKNAMIARIDMVVEGGGEKREALLSLAGSLIKLKEHEPFSPEKLEQSLDALKRTRLFRVIEVPDPVETPSGLHLTFTLTAYYRIRDIRISGAFPLLERKLITTMSIFVGDAFVPSTLRNQEERIRELYRKEGYPEPVVQVSADLGDPEKGVVINVIIGKGRFYSIRKCSIEGDHAFWGIRLKLRTNVYKASFLFGEGRRLIQDKLDEDIENLTKFYRMRGYPEVRITAEKDISENKKFVDEIGRAHV